MARSCVEVPMVLGGKHGKVTNSLPSASVCPRDVTRSQERTVRGSPPEVCAIWLNVLPSPKCPRQKKYLYIYIYISKSIRKKCACLATPRETVPCPFKNVWQKAHMIPELQSPIPSAKAASAFLSVWMLQQLRGEKIEDKAKTEEMWQFNGAFHGAGKTGAKGVILALLWASNRRIKMVGYRGALHFCLFFFFFLSPFDLLQI